MMAAGITAAPLRQRSAEIKGNPGETARRRIKRKLATFLVLGLALWVFVRTVYVSYFAGYFVPDVETDGEGRTRIRRRPQRHKQKYHPEQSTTEMDAALEGYLTLLDISIPPNALQGTGSYHGITAKFCSIDWKLQAKAPHMVPMFNDLVRQSKMCEGTTVSVDLKEFVERAREHDARASESGVTPPAVPPTGVVFHESRCGSTLVSNLLASLRRGHTRVYSEHKAHTSALTACDKTGPCNPDLRDQLIRDVFYATGRTHKTDPPRFVFYKISSIGTLHLDDFVAALPGVPWVYLYRDTVEVMQSHLVPDTLGGVQRHRKNPPCLRLRDAHPQPAATAAVVAAAGREFASLSTEEYCAAHLGALSHTALHTHQRTHTGALVNYDRLPGAVWEDLLPGFFGVTPTTEDIRRMGEASKNYAKDRGRANGEPFRPDADRKQQRASPEIVAAAAALTGSLYRQLEEAALPARARPGSTP